jgi:hypothetical protein
LIAGRLLNVFLVLFMLRTVLLPYLLLSFRLQLFMSRNKVFVLLNMQLELLRRMKQVFWIL